MNIKELDALGDEWKAAQATSRQALRTAQEAFDDLYGREQWERVMAAEIGADYDALPKSAWLMWFEERMYAAFQALDAAEANENALWLAFRAADWEFRVPAMKAEMLEYSIFQQ